MRIYFLLFFLCTTTITVASSNYKSILIENVPHIKQKPDFCGEACTAMYLQKIGKNFNQDDVFNQSGLEATLGRGCYTRELVQALHNIGFEPGNVWYKAYAPNFNSYIEKEWKKLHDDLLKGIPSIVCMHYSDEPNTTEHFRLILGYDAKKDQVIYHEPAVNNGAYQKIKREKFLKLWPLKYKKQEWTLIRIPLKAKAKNIKVQNNTKNFTDADFAQHILELKKKLPHKNFTILIESPFVVIGDEPSSMVEKRTTVTIKWAIDLLKKDYFSKEPDHIINIWLFKNKHSYETNVYKLFGTEPRTPFGYYSYSDKALVMNIATGGGTLVHEMVHPFIRANFPECPAWFNEGLASLYEQCREENGHIHGLTNWRLKGLQNAIRQKRVPTFKTLTSTTTYQFYQKDPGTNYSQARYLCYYLQQKNLLKTFYHEFHKNHQKDPTGYHTLKEVLKAKDMTKFHKEWYKFVLSLRF